MSSQTYLLLLFFSQSCFKALTLWIEFMMLLFRRKMVVLRHHRLVWVFAYFFKCRNRLNSKGSWGSHINWFISFASELETLRHSHLIFPEITTAYFLLLLLNSLLFLSTGNVLSVQKLLDTLAIHQCFMATRLNALNCFELFCVFVSSWVVVLHLKKSLRL